MRSGMTKDGDDHAGIRVDDAAAAAAVQGLSTVGAIATVATPTVGATGADAVA